MPAALPAPDLGLTWRPIGLDDVDAWWVLEKAIEEADGANERFDRDDLVEELTQGDHKDPARDSLIGFDASGTPRAFGLNNLLPGSTLRRAYLWGGVDPHWRGRGVGTALLGWQRDQARHALAVAEPAVGPPLPWRLLVSYSERLSANHAVVLAAGFTPVRWFHDMLRELTTPNAPPVPEVAVPQPLRMVPLTQDLDEAVRLAHNEAFASHWGSQPRDADAWQLWTVGHRTFRRDWSFAVVDPRLTNTQRVPEVAAYTISQAYPQDWQAQGFTQGWTALLGVRPGSRGQALAPALLAAAMRAFARDGMDKAGLDVDTGNASGALRLYERMGYTVEHTSVTCTIDGEGAARP